MAIDRIEPTRRPQEPVRGYQRWRELLFLHWPVDARRLRPLVPPGLDIDQYDGTAYVGLVPFAMEDVRPRWVPQRWGMSFAETNVRTYVHVGGNDPGVYFFSLDAESRIAVAAARMFWGLPYHYAKMTRHHYDDAIHYRLARPRGEAILRADWRVQGSPGAARVGSLEHFLIERYLLHVWRGGRLWTGRVHHRPYPIQTARLVHLEQSLLQAEGLPAVSAMPPLVHYAAGVDVEIFGLWRRH